MPLRAQELSFYSTLFQPATMADSENWPTLGSDLVGGSGNGNSKPQHQPQQHRATPPKDSRCSSRNDSGTNKTCATATGSSYEESLEVSGGGSEPSLNQTTTLAAAVVSTTVATLVAAVGGSNGGNGDSIKENVNPQQQTPTQSVNESTGGDGSRTPSAATGSGSGKRKKTKSKSSGYYKGLNNYYPHNVVFKSILVIS